MRAGLPSHWNFPGMVTGSSYVSLLRKGKICIAPLTRDMVVDGNRQLGDVDTTRSYELASMGCFFLHRRTPYLQSIYDERSEVPMWEDAEELASLIKYYLPKNDERIAIAARAQLRAVPAYSIDNRASEILEYLRMNMGNSEGVLN